MKQLGLVIYPNAELLGTGTVIVNVKGEHLEGTCAEEYPMWTPVWIEDGVVTLADLTVPE